MCRRYVSVWQSRLINLYWSICRDIQRWCHIQTYTIIPYNYIIQIRGTSAEQRVSKSIEENVFKLISDSIRLCIVLATQKGWLCRTCYIMLAHLMMMIIRRRLYLSRWAIKQRSVFLICTFVSSFPQPNQLAQTKKIKAERNPFSVRPGDNPMTTMAI